jgi:uncharacterized membrane protein YwaF
MSEDPLVIENLIIVNEEPMEKTLYVWSWYIVALLAVIVLFMFFMMPPVKRRRRPTYEPPDEFNMIYFQDPPDF